MDTPLNGFAVLLRTALGARWQFLHPDIRARFTLAPGATQQSFTGTMDEIDRSAIGWANQNARSVACCRRFRMR